MICNAFIMQAYLIDAITSSYPYIFLSLIHICFPSSANTIQLKVGISFISSLKARENVWNEIPHWSFEDTRQALLLSLIHIFWPKFNNDGADGKGLFGITLSQNAGGVFIVTPEAVSYTHLDVYKRQLLFSPK